MVELKRESIELQALIQISELSFREQSKESTTPFSRRD